MRSTDNPSDQNIVLPTVLVLFGALIYYISYIKYNVVQHDEGWLFNSAERMMDGEEWWIDFYVIWGPLRFWLMSKLFKLTGVNFFSARLLFIGLRLVGLGLMMAVCRRFMPTRWSILALLPAITAPSHIYKSDYLLFSMLVMWMLFRAWHSRNLIWLFFLGFVTGISCGFRLELFIPLTAICIFGLELGHLLFSSSIGARFIRRGMLLFGILAGLFPLWLFFPGFRSMPFIFLPLMGHVILAGSHGIPWPSLSYLGGGLDKAVTFFTLWITLLLYAGIAVDLVRVFFRSGADSLWGYRLMVFFIGCGITYGAIHQTNLPHMLQVLAPAYLLITEAGYRTVKRLGKKSLKLLVAVFFLGPPVFLVFYALFLSNLPGVRGLSARWKMKVPIRSRLGTVYYHSPRAEQIQNVVDYIVSNTKADDPVLPFPESLLIGVMAGRRNPSNMLPIVPIYLEYFPKKSRKEFYEGVIEAELIVYFERPTRLELPRQRDMKVRFFYPDLFEMVIKNYTLETRIADYIFLRKGHDPTSSTRAFMEGWHAYQQKHYIKAKQFFEKAKRKGAPKDAVEPLLMKITDVQEELNR